MDLSPMETKNYEEVFKLNYNKNNSIILLRDSTDLSPMRMLL